MALDFNNVVDIIYNILNLVYVFIYIFNNLGRWNLINLPIFVVAFTTTVTFYVSNMFDKHHQ